MSEAAVCDYSLLTFRLKAKIQGIPHRIANLANASALLYDALPDINWAGFYIAHNDRLILGPFQGKPACVEIPYGKGVCGTAFAENKTQLVPDVHKFPGHIACDSASNSEIVIPVHSGDRFFGVLDIDSPTVGRFSEIDRDGLEKFVSILEKEIFLSGEISYEL